jgi:fluoride ion exporter CrcB/FEX
LLADGELGIAVGYAVVTIVLGVVVTVVGVLLAGRLPWGGSR